MVEIQKRLGLIGVGNMGASILEGLFHKKLISPSRVWVYDKLEDKANDFAKKWKANRARSNEELVRSADVVLLAIKPQDLFAASSEFKKVVKSTQILISILAGTPLEKIRKAVGPKPALIRAMPNLGAKVGASVTAISGKPRSAVLTAEKIFSGCGQTLQLAEKFFDLVTAMSGSGPAYFFYLMEQMIEEGVRQGLPVGKAQQLAVQTALGAAKLAVSSDLSPGVLRQMVTSKGGTTEAALNVFHQLGAPSIISKAIQAACERGAELSRLK